MIFAVYAPLVLPALAVPVVRWLCGRLHPVMASWLIVVSALVLATCATLALALLTFVALAVMTVFARLGHWSPTVVRHLDAVHLPIDLVATVLLVVFASCATAATVTRVRSLLEAHRMARECPGDTELVVVQDARPTAHALPGRPGRIIVSSGMLASLAPAERRALLAHERGHLRRGHHLFVAAVDVLAAVHPLLRPLTTSIRFTTERWADEIAARQVGDRSVVARAVGKAALAARAQPARNGMTMAATAGPVPRRVAALLSAPPVHRLRSLLTAPTGVFAIIALALVTGSVWFSIDAAGDLHRVLELAQN
jgi:Zn-dependent protease with chaperone function